MSPKSVADKLLIKPNATVWSSDPSRLALIEPLPQGARTVEGLADATIALLFAENAGSLRNALDTNKDALGRPDALWVAYPKGNRADINRDTLWPIVAEYGMRPVTQVAVDDVWSVLRFRPLKPGEAV
jgi:hypothetical protein